MTALHIAGGLTLDGVIDADGSYEVDRLGGNALWAASGALLAGTRGRIHASVAADYPAAALRDLASAGFDVDAVTVVDIPRSLRVTFSYGPDGERQQPADAHAVARLPAAARARFIDTTGDAQVTGALLTTPDRIGPLDALTGTGWHLGLLPVDTFTALVDHLGRGADYVQADCPARSELRARGVERLEACLPQIDVFLPSTSDTAIFLPGTRPEESIDLFHRLGARVVVLKCAGDGAIVSDRAVGRWHVPAYPEPQASDATGAGDVFGGAFAAGMMHGRSLTASAALGAAAASIATRFAAPLAMILDHPAELDTRVRHIERNTQRI